MRAECPKCGSPNARYTRTHVDLFLTCLCGYEKLLFTLLGTAEIVHPDTGKDVQLPRDGTKLRKTLMALATLEEATSGDITKALETAGERFSTSDVCTYLTMLRANGLVVTTKLRRGMPGGSTWCLTDQADDLIGV